MYFHFNDELEKKNVLMSEFSLITKYQQRETKIKTQHDNIINNQKERTHIKWLIILF